MPARTSILAAANPVGGHYDQSKTVSENLRYDMTKHHLHKLSQGVQSPKFLLFSIFTARKRSLGQGNMFTPVCHSVYRGVPGPGGGCLVLGGLVETPPRTATAAGDTHPIGMHSCYFLKMFLFKTANVTLITSKKNQPCFFQHKLFL